LGYFLLFNSQGKVRRTREKEKTEAAAYFSPRGRGDDSKRGGEHPIPISFTTMRGSRVLRGGSFIVIRKREDYLLSSTIKE